MTAISGGIWLVSQGYSLAGLSVFVGTIVSLVGTFITQSKIGKSVKPAEKENKDTND